MAPNTPATMLVDAPTTFFRNSPSDRSEKPYEPKNYDGKPDSEIVADMHATDFHSPEYTHCFNALQLRLMARTARATWVLTWATGGLVLATVALCIVTLKTCG